MSWPPDVSGSIWIHAVIIGSLIPSFLQVRAGRASWVTGSEWISDVAGFIVLIIGAFVSVTLLQPIIGNLVAGYFISTPRESYLGAHIILGVAEYIAYKKIILGRFWHNILPQI